MIINAILIEIQGFRIRTYMIEYTKKNTPPKTVEYDIRISGFLSLICGKKEYTITNNPAMIIAIEITIP